MDTNPADGAARRPPAMLPATRTEPQRSGANAPLLIIDEAHSVFYGGPGSPRGLRAAGMTRRQRDERPGTLPSPIELAKALRAMAELTSNRQRAQEFLGQFRQQEDSFRGIHPSLKRENELGWCELACLPDEYRVEAHIGAHWWPDTYQQLWPNEPEHYSPEFDLCQQSNRHRNFEDAVQQAYRITKHLEPLARCFTDQNRTTIR